MSLPPWIDELKTRYMNDEASVFVLHGPGLRDVWRLDDAPMAAEDALITFLQRSRDIVGRWSFKEGLKFNNPSDHSLFTRSVEARQALDGATRRLNPRESLDALALIWLAISTPGRRLGFVLSGVEGLLPENRKRIDALPGNTPALTEWPSNATLRASDNVIVLLVERLDRVRPELFDGCVIIEVPAAPKAVAAPKAAAAAPPPPPPDRAVAEAEIEALSAARRLFHRRRWRPPSPRSRPSPPSSAPRPRPRPAPHLRLPSPRAPSPSASTSPFARRSCATLKAAGCRTSPPARPSPKCCTPSRPSSAAPWPCTSSKIR
ncbi:MAG: hypothetical protein IPN01_03420 [Deltaproteobacteria bacterium]|nr:hypothetical protein [Deltaproteobacteria bacterium]